MLVLDGDRAYQVLKDGIRNKSYRYPAKEEPRYEAPNLLPLVKPRFKLDPGDKVFTIGSCFAREIEHHLHSLKLDVPMLRYTIPPAEFPYAPPHMLNEYNAGTILQRINSVFGDFTYHESAGVEGSGDQYIDLFLHIHQRSVPLPRLHERRSEIDATYSELRDSDAVIITFGLTESWFDKGTGCYLNKAPSRSLVSSNPGRFYFHRMDYEDVVEKISETIVVMNKCGKKKILLSVSPVPIEATFTGQDAIIANYHSKSTLRAAVQAIYEKFDNVDYFPSYEIALSGGTSSFKSDNIHIEDGVVERIMKFMIESYFDGPAGQAHDAGDKLTTNYIDEEVESRIDS